MVGTNELQRVLGSGVDVVDVGRFEAALRRTPRLEQRLFGEAERAQATGVHRAERLAARFAAKEAVLKAIGSGLRGCRFHDIVIERDALGKPQVRLCGGALQQAASRGIDTVLVSISHSGTTAVAFAIAGR